MSLPATTPQGSVRGLPEARGYVMTYMPRGIAQLIVPLFLTPALIDICDNHPPTWLDLNCTTIPLVLVLAAIAILIIMTPVVGVLCEYTARRKSIAWSLNVGFCFTMLALVAFGPQSWQVVVFVAMLHGPVVELAHEAVNTYLPELSPLNSDRVALSSTGLLLYVITAVTWGAIVAILGFSVDFFSSPAALVRLAAVSSFCVALPLVLLSQKKLEPRPAAKQADPGTNLASFAWKHTIADMGRVRRECPELAKYLLARAFFFGAQRQVAFTASLYIKVVVGENPQVPVLIAFTLAGAGAALGLLASRRPNSLKKVVVRCVSCLAVANSLMPFIYYKSSQKYMGLVYGVLWGLLIGLNTAVERAMFASMVPAKQEALLFGMFHFSNSIFEWGPALLFAIMQISTGEIRYAPLCLSGMLAVGLLLLLRVDVDAARNNADGQWDSRRISSSLSKHMSGSVGDIDAMGVDTTTSVNGDGFANGTKGLSSNGNGASGISATSQQGLLEAGRKQATAI